MLWSQDFHLWLQAIGQHIAILAQQVQILDVQFFKNLFFVSDERILFGVAWDAYVERVQWLAYANLGLLACGPPQSNYTHNQVRLAGQLFIDKLFLNLRPVAQMDADWSFFVDAADQVLI